MMWSHSLFLKKYKANVFEEKKNEEEKRVNIKKTEDKNHLRWFLDEKTIGQEAM